MSRIGRHEIGGRPLVVGVISQPRTLEHPPPRAPACDIAEFRIDLFGVGVVGWLERAREFQAAGVPVIATCRHRAEGGRWYRDEEERLAVYRSIVPHVAAIDVEIRSGSLGAAAELAAAGDCCLIGSFHDFEGTPPEREIAAVVKQGIKAGAGILKVATTLGRPEDLATLTHLLRRFPSTHLCALGMGPDAAEARIALALEGSCLVYGFLDAAVAPGQVSAAELRKRLAESHPGYAAWLAEQQRDGRSL
jgi:3-dehydroquinate dehydratase I